MIDELEKSACVWLHPKPPSFCLILALKEVDMCDRYAAVLQRPLYIYIVYTYSYIVTEHGLQKMQCMILCFKCGFCEVSMPLCPSYELVAAPTWQKNYYTI